MAPRRARHVAAFAVLVATAAPSYAGAEEGAPPEQTQWRASLGSIDVSGNLTGVAQQVNAGGTEDGSRASRANYRGDVGIALPGGRTGDVEGKFFVHVRFGQGTDLPLRPTYTSTANTTAFESSAGPSAAYVTVAEAWYQLSAPLPHGGLGAQSSARTELTLGKMDPFGFFDQNAVADDETVRFLNNAFVHNPLLDSGGDTGADRYGFAPGVRFGYFEKRGESDSWSASVAAFASGPAASFDAAPAGPFVIGQVATTHSFSAGLSGTYRAYVWTNGRTTDFDGAFERHTGFGISIDQLVAEAVTVWGRYGHEISGQVRFDRALTLGAEAGGARWGRSADAAGIAVGFLRTSGDYRGATASGTLAGYAASGAERIAELYYRWRVNDRFDLTPDVQWIRRPGGNASAPDIVVAGVRGRLGFE